MSKSAALYAAGFTTAFGAHSVAAGLGAEQHELGLGLLGFGVLLAVYDAAEVILKPVFGALSDRVGPKPVIVFGLLAFTLFSFIGIFAASSMLGLALVRLGQGAAASAFSPASSAAVARIAGPGRTGKFFGRYGSWKTLGYVLGPLLGAGLIFLGGFPALFGFMTLMSLAALAWITVSMPSLAPLPKQRFTVLDLARQVVAPGFLLPVFALACATGALGVAVGFLPQVGASLHLDSFGSMAVVSVLALCSALVQPKAGRLHDEGKLGIRSGLCSGLLLAAAGLGCLAWGTHPAFLYLAAILLGSGIGVATPLGFSYLAAATPGERMGRTMGSAELGRELGDAGGPLLVGAIAAAASVAAGLWVLAAVLVCAAAASLLLSTKSAMSRQG